MAVKDPLCVSSQELLSFHMCYLTSITSIIGVIKQIWLHKSGFCSFPASRNQNAGNTGEGIFSLGRLAGVRADASRICRRRIMALQASAEVEHGRLSLRRKEYGSVSRVRFPHCQVVSTLNLSNCHWIKSSEISSWLIRENIWKGIFILSSFISGVTILGTPAEIYNFGTQYWITIISIFFSGVVVAFIYAPVFVSLGLNSVYEVYLPGISNECVNNMYA